MSSFDPTTIENIFFHVRDDKTGRKYWAILKNCRIEGIELEREVAEEFRTVTFPDEAYAFIPTHIVKTNFTISGSTPEVSIGLEGTKYVLHEDTYGD